MAKAIVLVVLDQMLIEVGEDKIYAIIADECTDVTRNESLIVIIRYINSLSLSLVKCQKEIYYGQG